MNCESWLWSSFFELLYFVRNKKGKGIVRAGYGNKKEWDF